MFSEECPKFGNVKRIKNYNKANAANEYYHYVRIINDKNVEMNLLLTDSDLITAIKRAEKNKDDITRSAPITYKFTRDAYWFIYSFTVTGALLGLLLAKLLGK